jgi:hypothetical protein
VSVKFWVFIYRPGSATLTRVDEETVVEFAVQDLTSRKGEPGRKEIRDEEQRIRKWIAGAKDNDRLKLGVYTVIALELDAGGTDAVSA